MTENLKKSTVMVIDDLPANLDLLQLLLEDNGHSVQTFSSGILALQAASQKPPDLILLDINMPEMNGYDVCKRLKDDEKLKDIPVIFISSQTDTAAIVRAFSIGGIDYVAKPFQFEEVQTRVRTHLSLSIAHRELKKQNDILQENIRLREFVDQIPMHDLKGTITPLINVPEMMIIEGNLLPNQIELLQFVSDSALHLLDMIHHSVDLLSMELGSYNLNPVLVNVIKILQTVCRELESLAKQKNISIVTLLDQKPVGDDAMFELPGEEFLFFSMFSNLIKNAIEASPNGKEITIAFSTKHTPTFVIENKGSIPEQIRDRFFQRFVTFGKKRGTGLGVYSAKLMARTLGGNLSFTTNDVDGTRLMFTMSTDKELSQVKNSESSMNHFQIPTWEDFNLEDSYQ